MAEAVQMTYVDERGQGATVGPTAAALVEFAAVSPVRAFPSYKGQRNFPGYYFAACTGRLVGFESWLERNEAMALDFAADVAAFAAQPFELRWTDHTGPCRHTPDFFARRSDGAGVVIDCRPEGRIKPRDQELFDGTADVCRQMGWKYRVVHGHDPVWLANVQWLAGYRLPRFRVEPAVGKLLDAFATPGPLAWVAAEVGDPIAVLPAAYHLVWSGELHCDLSRRLDGLSVVTRA